MKKLLLLLFTLLGMTVNAQMRTVTGTVLSAEDEEPLVGVTVMAVGVTGVGAATDIDGNFTISVPTSVKKLKFSYVGMETVTRDIPKDGKMKIEMLSLGNSLDEVMVVAYGTTKKSAYTGSASVVKADQIEKTLVTDVVSALNGTVSGVQLQSSSGQPGSVPTIKVRGTGSILASNNPLYVIDGVPSSDMTSVNPNDVESITVLKDAAAAALYGARGANGVILVTTKTGKSGKSKVTVDMNWGANSREVGRYDIITDPRIHYQLIYQALRNSQVYNLGADPLSAHMYAAGKIQAAPESNPLGYQIFTVPEGEFLIGADGKFNPNATLGYLYTKADGSQYWLTKDDWVKEAFTNGFRQQYNVQISGGTDKFDYLVSGSYLGDDGVIKQSSYDRITTRLTGNYQVNKWLKIGANMAYSNEIMNSPSGQSVGNSESAFYACYQIAPIYPYYVRNADGTILWNERTNSPTYDFGYSGYGVLGLDREEGAGANPTGMLVYNTYRYETNTFDGKWYAQIAPVDGLTVTGTFSYWLNQSVDNLFQNPIDGWPSTFGGEIDTNNSLSKAFNVQVLANYHKSFGVNNLDVLLGYEGYQTSGQSSTAYGFGTFSYDDIYLNNTSEDWWAGGSASKYGTMGFFGRINYNYNEKYFGMVSYRRDASSRFAPKHRWGNFFSVSGGWDIAKEKFMEEATAVDMLKFKASFGQQGNDGIGNYRWTDTYYASGSEGLWSFGWSSKGNPDITWETSNAFNIGIDYSFFQGRLEGTLEYFSRQTSNMLYNRPVQPSQGYTSIPMNIGSMRNYGAEFELRAIPVRTRDFNWDLNFNITYIKNKIIKLAPELNGELIWGDRIQREGLSYYTAYMVKYAGVNPQNGEALYWGRHADGTEFKTNDWNTAYSGNTATGDVSNRSIICDYLPPFYGGFGTTISWKGIDASIQFAYQIGGHIFDYGYEYVMSNGQWPGIALHKDALKSWTPENPNTNVPRLDFDSDYVKVSDRWITSASYLALNNINIGYNFPVKLVRKIGLQNLRFYFAADNVALWSKRKGLDPRQSYSQNAPGNYSALRTLSGGLSVTF